MGLGSLIALSFLFSTGLAYTETSSSRCPATSVAGIPGCWGTPGCAYVIAKNLGPGAMCEFNYCNCGGVAAPLLPTVIAGTSTVGCNYPTQPASSNCPSETSPSAIPTLEPATPGLAPSDATVITGTVEGGVTVTQTFVPTTYTELATLTIVSTIVRTQTEAISTVTNEGKISSTMVPLPAPVMFTITVGPSGVAWVPFSTSSGAAPLPPPTVLPGVVPIVASSSINEGPVPVSSSSSGSMSSDDGPHPTITLSDIAILTITSIDPSISENTAISTSDGNHPAGVYPFIRGGPKCFFCPPGVDGGGFVLWGMNKPGVYPPPVPPPVPNVPWPTITIGPGNKPTPGSKPGSEEPGEPERSQNSEGCTTTTASSCAVSCTTPSGKSTESCTTTRCETTSGCSVTNIASTTTKSGSCSPTNWANLQNGNEDFSGSDGGEEGPDPSYAGSVPSWVTAWPSEIGFVSSKVSGGGASTTTPAPHPFCVPYRNPSKGTSYCVCDDHSSRSFVDDKGNCPSTSQASGVIIEPTPEPPKTDGNGNIWNSTDIVSGTIWGCKSTSIVHGLAPVPITKCLSSSSIGLDFTPTSAPTETTLTPAQPTDNKKECEECYSDLGASRCGPDDNDCLVNECKAEEHCKACGIDCSTIITGSLTRRRYELFARAITSARPQEMSNKLSRRKVIEPTPLARNAGHDGPRSLYKRVEHKPAWIKFAPKGLRYYKMLQEKPMEDAQDPKMCELDDYFNVERGDPTTPLSKNHLFEKIGLTPTKSYYALMVFGPKKGKSKDGEQEEIGDFQDTLSAEQGVFFANANDRGEEKDANGVVTRKPIPYQMSTVAWWMWKHTVMLGQDPGIKEEDTDFSNLKYFFRVNIDNSDTIEILTEALGDSAEPMEFTPKDEGPDNAFWPLLGSPNGNTIAWLLADHKRSLKGKGIEKITAWRNGRNHFIWATIK
ncbi:Nn.00g066560.m01.CDS01 [Neocucurbitaria sp. VM-36]